MTTKNSLAGKQSIKPGQKFFQFQHSLVTFLNVGTVFRVEENSVFLNLTELDAVEFPLEQFTSPMGTPNRLWGDTVEQAVVIFFHQNNLKVNRMADEIKAIDFSGKNAVKLMADYKTENPSDQPEWSKSVKVGDLLLVKETAWTRAGREGEVVEPIMNDGVSLEFYEDVFGDQSGDQTIEFWQWSELQPKEI